MALRLGAQDGGFASGLVLGPQDEPTNRVISGSGACAAQDATVAGSAERVIVDTGTPPYIDAQGAVIVGAGAVARSGTGVLVAQSASASGTGSIDAAQEITGSGAAVAQSAAVAGVGERAIEGAGDTQAQSASASGDGAIGYSGVGVIEAGDATVAAIGEITITGSGTLSAQNAIAVANGLIGGTIGGTGYPAAQSSSVVGDGDRVSHGSGQLLAQPATVLGQVSGRFVFRTSYFESDKRRVVVESTRRKVHFEAD